MRAAAITLAAGAAVALVACGGDDGNQAIIAPATTPAQASAQAKAVRARIDELAAASRAGDAGKICDEILTKRLADVIAKANPAKDCRRAVTSSLVSPKETIAVLSVTVTGTTARATIREQNRNRSLLALVQQDGSWRIDGIRGLSKG